MPGATESGMPRTLGVVLAGGTGTRVGGADKGLLPLSGRPLVEHVVARLRPQCAELLVVANRHLNAYARHARVIRDVVGDHAGPLAGIAAALEDVTMQDDEKGAPPFAALLTVPVDCPAPPPDLCARLWSGLAANPGAQCVFVHDGAGPQPLFALYRIDPGMREGLLRSARDALRLRASPSRWHREIGAVAVDFSDSASGFDNLNTPEDFQTFERRSSA